MKRLCRCPVQKIGQAATHVADLIKSAASALYEKIQSIWERHHSFAASETVKFAAKTVTALVNPEFALPKVVENVLNNPSGTILQPGPSQKTINCLPSDNKSGDETKAQKLVREIEENYDKPKQQEQKTPLTTMLGLDKKNFSEVDIVKEWEEKLRKQVEKQEIELSLVKSPEEDIEDDVVKVERKILKKKKPAEILPALSETKTPEKSPEPELKKINKKVKTKKVEITDME